MTTGSKVGLAGLGVLLVLVIGYEVILGGGGSDEPTVDGTETTVVEQHGSGGSATETMGGQGSRVNPADPSLTGRGASGGAERAQGGGSQVTGSGQEVALNEVGVNGKANGVGQEQPAGAGSSGATGSGAGEGSERAVASGGGSVGGSEVVRMPGAGATGGHATGGGSASMGSGGGVATTGSGADPMKLNVGSGAANTGTGVRVYVVKDGDSLWDIAEAQLGNGARMAEIVKANPQLKDPDVLKKGMRLNIPPRQVVAGSGGATNTTGGTSTAAAGAKRVRVVEAESLWVIAVREYGNGQMWKVIYNANRDVLKNPDDVPAGVVLVIPKVGSQPTGQ